MDERNSQPGFETAGSDLTIGVSIFVLGCFFLSGLTGLVYEILWTRMIVKVIGSAPFSVSIILTVFMGGLGLGSFLASRVIDRIKEPPRLLRLYAWLELAIGGYGIILPVLLLVFKPFYQVVYNQLFHYFLLYSILTLIGCAFLLFIPVTCMGATLPVLCRFYVVQLGHLATRTGRLYALNTVGAALGSLLCGFWLINLLSVWGTLAFAVLLNSLIGIACLAVSLRGRAWLALRNNSVQSSPDLLRAPRIPAAPRRSYSSGEVRGALFIFALSGFCAMAYEVIWTKLLGLIIGPTTYSFTIILATFIVGLALGSLIFGWWGDRVKEPLWLLIATQLGAALLALGVSQLLGNSQFFFAKLIYHFKEEFDQLSFVKAISLFIVMLGPTLCLGATFPLVGKIYTSSLTWIGRSIGFAYAINALGAVLGAFAADFLLIPWCGKEHSLRIVTGMQLFTALAVGSYLMWEKRSHPVRLIPLGVMILLGFLLCFSYPHWNRQLLSTGRYHHFESFSSDLRSSGWLEALWRGQKLLAKYNSNLELVYYGDGIGGFTTVIRETDALGIPEYLLLNSGKTDASSRWDMPTQTLSTHFPLLFHPNPQEVMVLGLASGVTAGEVLYYPIERLDVVDISRQVVAASNFFIPWNNGVLSHPKTELIIQDGRAHLELTDRNYDVIISEPSNPWMAGLASLFTKEFFLLARERLKKDGIFVQFLHTYQMDWSTFALVGRTFSQVFPESILVNTYPAPDNLRKGSDYLLIGFKGNNRLEVANAYEKMSYLRQSKNIVLPDPRALYRLVVSEDLQRLFGTGPVHSDNWPRLEFAAPRQMYTSDPAIEKNMRSQMWLSPATRAILQEVANVEGQIAFAALALSLYQPFYNMVDGTKATPKQRERLVAIVEDYCTHSLIKDYDIFADQLLKERCLERQIAAIENNLHLVPDKTMAYTHLADAYYAKGELERSIEWNQQALAADPTSAEVYFKLGMAYSKKEEFTRAITEYEKVLELDPHFAEARNNLGNIYFKRGELDKAVSELGKALALNPYLVESYNNLGNAYFKKGELDRAISEYKRATAIDQHYAEAYHNCGIVYRKKGELDKAIAEFTRAITVKPDYVKAHYNLAIAYYYKGDYKLALHHCDKTIELGGQVDPKLFALLEAHR